MAFRKFSGIWALLALLFLHPWAAHAELDGLARITERGEVIVAVDPGYPPASFIDEKQELAGFDVDVAREIAKRLGVRARLVSPSWKDMVHGAWNSRWDVAVSSITPTAERAEHIDFPTIYYFNPVSVAVHKDNLEAQTVYDLDGKTIGVCDSCSAGEYLRKKLEIVIPSAPYFSYKLSPGSVRTYINDQAAIEDLSVGDGQRLDAVLSPSATLRHAIEKGAPLRVLDDQVYYEPLAIAVAKGQPALSKKIRQVVLEMHRDKTLQNLSYKWFSEDLTVDFMPRREPSLQR